MDWERSLKTAPTSQRPRPQSPVPSTLKRLNTPAPPSASSATCASRAPRSYSDPPCSDLHRLAPRDPHPHLRLAPATVYASSHTTHFAYPRAPHAHPHIRRHTSTDFHTLRPPPMNRRALSRPHPPRNARPPPSRTCIANTARIQHGNYKTRRRRECPHEPVPSHVQPSTPHAGIRIRTHTRR
ncbi:hypothetical protein B0H13DRAFT_2345617 [Mycena leptocephala]|nr:hypothetical protein B0H13DRAFT_2345617 [Mycena leptocephala]